MTDVPLGFGTTAKSTMDARSMDPGGIVVSTCSADLPDCFFILADPVCTGVQLVMTATGVHVLTALSVSVLQHPIMTSLSHSQS